MIVMLLDDMGMNGDEERRKRSLSFTEKPNNSCRGFMASLESVPSRESGHTVHLTDLEPENKGEDVITPQRRRMIIPVRLRRMVVRNWKRWFGSSGR